MNGNREALKNLQQQTLEKRRLDARLRELYAQRETLKKQTEELEQARQKEQADVGRLEGRSLAAFFYHTVGRLDEKLDKERQEAYAAQVKYDAVARELAAVEEDAARCESRLTQLEGCEQVYETALAKKAAALRESGSAAAQELLDAEARIADLEGQLREIREAADAGEAALNAADQVLKTLDSAEGWSTWDVVGGGLLADLAKYEDLDNAQEQVEQLQEKLRQFKTELADVTIEAELQVSVDGFLRFADVFFDGLFADLAVMEHINDSQKKIRNTQKEIQAVLDRLTAMRKEISADLDSERERADRITLDTPI